MDESTEGWLVGDGEIVELIRSKDWSQTALGPIDAVAREPAHDGLADARLLVPDQRDLGPGRGADLEQGLLARLRREAPARVRQRLPRVLGLRVAGDRRRVRDGPQRRDGVPREPADVPGPQRLPRGDLVHVLAEPDPRRDGRGRRPVPPGRRDDRAHARGPAHARAARPRRLRRRRPAASRRRPSSRSACSATTRSTCRCSTLVTWSTTARPRLAGQTGGRAHRPAGASSPTSSAPARTRHDSHSASARHAGPHEEPLEQALFLPISPPGAERPAGVLVAGISTRLPLDETYRGFFDLVAQGVTSALANALAYEQERARAEALAEHRPRQDRVLLQRLARVPHAADADARAAGGGACGRRRARSRPRAASGWRPRTATACGCCGW